MYAVVILSIKFFMNLSIADAIFESDQYKYWSGLLKIGLRKEVTINKDGEKSVELIHILKYLLPEMMIITFVMLNQIQLRLLGLYYDIEEDFESVKDAFQRYVSQGDLNEVNEEKKKRTYMYLDKFFISNYDQQKQLEHELEEEEIQKKLQL